MTEVEAAAETPAAWTLCFGPSGSAWINRLVPGRFKHVRAYAYLPGLKAWLFCEKHLYGMSVIVAPDGKETLARVMWPFVKDCELVSFVRAQAGTNRHIGPIVPNTCVSMVKGLIGLKSGALLPDRLFRDVLAAGGEVLGRTPLHAAGPGPGACPPAAAERPAARPCAADAG